jgi:hypothetical protein
MHIPPSVWGPFFWHTIHIAILGYPNEPAYEHKKAAKEFFESLQTLIPCPVCREHYKTHLEKYPITPHLDKRADLFRWTLLLHNEVNKQLGKPVYTEQQVLQYYDRLGKRGRSPVWNENDFVEADMAARIQGMVTGAVAVGAVCAIFWLVSSSEGKK